MKNHLQTQIKTYRKISIFTSEHYARNPLYSAGTSAKHVLRKSKGPYTFSLRKFITFDTIEALKNSGFPHETEEVTTEDGYILTLHRILTSKQLPLILKGSKDESDKIPVLLQHGLWSSSGDWIVSGSSHSLAFMLAQNGYDVWLGNARGNLYSRKHRTLCPEKNCKEFWDFSWHEMGCYDLAAMVDHVLSITNSKQLYYIGHSLGTTMCFVLLSTRPQYNKKIKAMYALAPIAYLGHMKSGMLQRLAGVSDGLLEMLQFTGYYSFLPRNEILTILDSLLSKNADKLVNNAGTLLSNLSGYASDSTKKHIKEVILSHIAAGTSLKVLAHFAQCVRNKKTFRHFDFGKHKNLSVYGKTEPPNYQLCNINVPVLLYYSPADWLSTLEDVEQLADDLEKSTSSGLIRKKIELTNFNHLDFIWGTIAKPTVFNDILMHMKTL